MRKLIPYLKGYYLQSILGPLFKLLEVCFELLVPLIMAAIIDTGIASSDTGYILRLGGLLVLMGVLGLASALTAQYFAAKAAFGFGTALRRDLFAHINRLSFSQLDVLGCAGLITRITGDINQAQSGVNLVLRLFLRSPFVVAGALIMAFSIHRGGTAFGIGHLFDYGMEHARLQKSPETTGQGFSLHPGKPQWHSGHPGFFPAGYRKRRI